MKTNVLRQSRRRGVVLICYLMCALLLTALWVAGKGIFSKEVVIVMLVLAVIGVLASVTWISKITRGYGVDSFCDASADERQLAVRNAAYRTAYLALSSTLVVGALYVSLATSKKLSSYLWIPGNTDDWQVVCGGLILLASSLPQAVIAWMEPDISEESLPDIA